ncbi:hypothetical protein SAMN05444392_102456 [Seinonella peptonophila]|uniref:DUF309 domain-containing protein n=1 Tax=Seinonella peptonophila TaxID=112248 RepID=A0A1M4VP97_9BACL|nr:DUF309 domain-containing protein [Seinonella peptonophila]SHE70660.1 hypothetical protein SAMN05444392_102456 [Seinonella peptonophila]
MNYDPLYFAFFRHYHQKEYWEAHEVLEELWQNQRDNDFYHGLIQVAAIMHQLERGKVRGARKLATTALYYLKPYAPMCQDVDVSTVLTWLQQCLDVLPVAQERMSLEELQKLGIPICKLPQFE